MLAARADMAAGVARGWRWLGSMVDWGSRDHWPLLTQRVRYGTASEA